MRKILLFVALMLVFVVTVSAQNKKVAVMETKADRSVSTFQSKIIRGSMEVAAAHASGYEAYDRTAFDVIMKEHNFQRSGLVKDSDIKRLGEMAAVQYILVTEASKEDDYLYILAKMLDVETGHFLESADELCEATPVDIKESCDKLKIHLFGKDVFVKNNGNKDKASLRPLPYRYKEEKDKPAAMFYFRYQSSRFNLSQDNNKNDLETLRDLISNYSINGFIIGGFESPEEIDYESPEESDFYGARAQTISYLIKSEIEKAGLNVDDYEFVTEEPGVYLEGFVEQISRSSIRDKEKIIQTIVSSSNPEAEIKVLLMLYPEIEKLFPLLRCVEVYVY